MHKSERGLSDHSGTSGFTYKHGVLDAMKHTQPALFFWENVTTVAETDEPPVQKVAEDMDVLGYVFEWTKVDAQNYLLRQRRNRVYGSADLNSGQDAKSYAEAMEKTMRRMESDVRFPFAEVFDETLPPEKPRNNTAQHNVDLAKQKSQIEQHTDLYVDASNSKSRGVEAAMDVLPCIKPTHPIYSIRLERYVTVAEMFKAQGLFRDDFDNPEAVDEILRSDKDAQDLVGNAFASTCCQAKILSSLVNSHGWETLSSSASSTQPTTLARKRPAVSTFAEPKRRCRRKTNPSDATPKPAPAAASNLDRILQNMQVAEDGKKAKRPRQHQRANLQGTSGQVTISSSPPKKSRKQYADGKMVKRQGKKAVPSIAGKVELMRELRLFVMKGPFRIGLKFHSFCLGFQNYWKTSR